MNFSSVLEYSHYIIKSKINSGDVVIDATMGNGHDTLFLADLVKENGKVYSFDIQSEAIDITRKKLNDNNLLSQVTCILDSHEKIDELVKEPIKAAMFNLGYLPGADKISKTNPTITIEALKHAYKLLTTGGIITIVIYTRHDNGYEAEKVEEFLKTLPQQEVSVMKCSYLNQANYPPYVIVIEKR